MATAQSIFQMAEPGLRASIWASNTENSGSFSRSSGQDWTCFQCGYLNFARRMQCYNCSIMKGEMLESNDHVSPIVQNVIAADTKKYSCTQPLGSRTNRLAEDYCGHHSRKRGLSTSRWAPRNSSGNQGMPGQADIWTRTVQKEPLTSRTAPNTSPILKPTLADLGLPYEVQHYILALIQRILEEGCWDFAIRWIPQILKHNGWTCSQAVEISSWRNTLPTAVPAPALISTNTSQASLTEALGHAVRIRNSAVHRHLCDNEELRQMATQAQKLMHIFNDSAREDKLRRLWYALKDWDVANHDDALGKRKSLERALQEVAEMEVDDMDWTPNAVSLQEVEEMGTNSDTQSGSDSRWEEDEMELD